MAPGKPKKTYFLAPNFNYGPGGSLSLGRILTDPFDPGMCVNPGGVLPFPPEMPVQTSIKTGWKSERSRRRGGAFGIWAEFLRFLGAEVEASIEWKVDKSSIYEFDELETQFIDPTRDYIERSVLDVPSVVSHIIEAGYRKPIYMITGTMIARGAAISSRTMVDVGGALKLGADGLPMAVPLSAGPKINLFQGKTERTTFSGSSDFVFAYRLREIYYERKLQLRDRQYTSGALLSCSCSLDSARGSEEIMREEVEPHESDDQPSEYTLAVGQCASESETVDLMLRVRVVDMDEESDEYMDEDEAEVYACVLPCGS